MTNVLSKSSLCEAVTSWLDAGWRVGGPQRSTKNLVQYEWISAAEDLMLDGFIRPANSIKSFFLPRHEELFTFRGQGKQTQLTSAVLPERPQVVLAARPCDAAALPVLDHVFNWDYRDTFFNQRRERTTVVTLACTEHDAACFCTSVGLGPDSSEGADVVLVPLGDQEFEVRCITDKGRALLLDRTQPSDRTATVGPGPELQFDLERAKQRLADGISDEAWQMMTLSCLGCGACAHSCPTCHCFDMVDHATREGGGRVRNWDTCQAAVYSLHASGHNPRSHQAARQRNRLVHKYQTYPAKFGAVLCTGCGACGRNCAAGLGVKTVLQQLAAVREPQEHLLAGAGVEEQTVTKDSV